jgi:hypothetical protein
LVSSSSAFFSNFTLVIATQVWYQRRYTAYSRHLHILNLKESDDQFDLVTCLTKKLFLNALLLRWPHHDDKIVS